MNKSIRAACLQDALPLELHTRTECVNFEHGAMAIQHINTDVNIDVKCYCCIYISSDTLFLECSDVLSASYLHEICSGLGFHSLFRQSHGVNCKVAVAAKGRMGIFPLSCLSAIAKKSFPTLNSQNHGVYLAQNNAY